MKRLDFSENATLIFNYLYTLPKFTKAMFQPKFWENHHQYTIEKINGVIGKHLNESMPYARQYNRTYLLWSMNKKGVALLVKYLRIKGKLEPDYYLIKNRVYKNASKRDN